MDEYTVEIQAGGHDDGGTEWRYWLFYAEVRLRTAHSMLGDLGYNPNGDFGLQNQWRFLRGCWATVKSQGAPEWMVRLKAVLDEQGVDCTLWRLRKLDEVGNLLQSREVESSH